MGSTLQIFDHPSHPYTRALLRCLPEIAPERRELVEIGGQPLTCHAWVPGARSRRGARSGNRSATRRTHQRRPSTTATSRTAGWPPRHADDRRATDASRRRNGVLLEATELKKYFPVASGFAVRPSAHVDQGPRRGERPGGRGRDPGHRRGIGIRQDHPGQVAPAPGAPHRGCPALRRQARSVPSISDDLARYRRSVQAVFQDPYSSLNPRMRVEHIVAEPLLGDDGAGRAAVRKRVGDVLEMVGLTRESSSPLPA